MLNNLNTIAANEFLKLYEDKYYSQYWSDISNRSKGNIRKYDWKKVKTKRKLQGKSRKINWRK